MGTWIPIYTNFLSIENLELNTRLAGRIQPAYIRQMIASARALASKDERRDVSR